MSDATVTVRELATAMNRKPEQVEAEAAGARHDDQARLAGQAEPDDRRSPGSNNR